MSYISEVSSERYMYRVQDGEVFVINRTTQETILSLDGAEALTLLLLLSEEKGTIMRDGKYHLWATGESRRLADGSFE